MCTLIPMITDLSNLIQQFWYLIGILCRRKVFLNSIFFHVIGNPIVFFKRFYLFIFREVEREGERKGEKHQCVVASCVPPTRDWSRNPGLCPDWELNW